MKEKAVHKNTCTGNRKRGTSLVQIKPQDDDNAMVALWKEEWSRWKKKIVCYECMFTCQVIRFVLTQNGNQKHRVYKLLEK